MPLYYIWQFIFFNNNEKINVLKTAKQDISPKQFKNTRKTT